MKAASESWILANGWRVCDWLPFIDLTWRIEALWALVWVGGLVDHLDATAQAGDSLAGLFRTVRKGEMPTDFIASFEVRPYAELYSMRDLHYRLNWLTRDGQLNRYDTGPFKNSVIVERRWALEWATDQASEWDEVDLGT